MLLSVLLYRKVLEPDRKLLAPVCAGKLAYRREWSVVSARVDGEGGGRGANNVFLPQNISFVTFSALPTCISTHFRSSDVLGCR